MKQCMNFKFVILFALTLLVGSTVYGQDNVIDEVVWVVGDEAILKSEVEEARMSALYGLYDEHVNRQHRFARENGGILQQDFQSDS